MHSKNKNDKAKKNLDEKNTEDKKDDDILVPRVPPTIESIVTNYLNSDRDNFTATAEERQRFRLFDKGKAAPAPEAPPAPNPLDRKTTQAHDKGDAKPNMSNPNNDNKMEPPSPKSRGS